MVHITRKFKISNFVNSNFNTNIFKDISSVFHIFLFFGNAMMSIYEHQKCQDWLSMIDKCQLVEFDPCETMVWIAILYMLTGFCTNSIVHIWLNFTHNSAPPPSSPPAPPIWTIPGGLKHVVNSYLQHKTRLYLLSICDQRAIVSFSGWALGKKHTHTHTYTFARWLSWYTFLNMQSKI